ncbi:sugar ABC transporter substrate-binding protein [Streptomyces sp. NPDC060198]|uniref:sugar ABC transporter substrate-binding protein n=1 Tax=Streptomyces sp. NPDC060198 TaxID=3347070 RepID=UPI00364D1722
MRLSAGTRSALATAVALGTIAVLGGCGSGSGPGDGSAVTLGFVNGDTSEFATCLQKAVERTAKQEGARLLLANSHQEAGKELSNIEDMITHGVDALVVQTVNVDALEGAVAHAESAGVPIYLTSVATDDVSGILGAAVVDLHRLGEMDAGWVAKDAGGKPVKVGVVAGAPGAASDFMVSGFTEALPAGADVVANQPAMFNPVKAQDVAQNMIQAHPDLDYVFVANEEMALAVRKTFDAAGAHDVEIVTENGTDAGLAAIRDGRLSATVANSPKVIGETAIERTLALLDDGAPESGKAADKITDIPLTMVTAENADDAPQYCDR